MLKDAAVRAGIPCQVHDHTGARRRSLMVLAVGALETISRMLSCTIRSSSCRSAREQARPRIHPRMRRTTTMPLHPGASRRFDYYIVMGHRREIDKIWTPSSSCYGPKRSGSVQHERARAQAARRGARGPHGGSGDVFLATSSAGTRWPRGQGRGVASPALKMTIDTPPFKPPRSTRTVCAPWRLIVNTTFRYSKNREVIEVCSPSVSPRRHVPQTYTAQLNCLSQHTQLHHGLPRWQEARE
jgi:hypothetical protein